MAASEKTKKALWVSSGGVCVICREVLWHNSSELSDTVLVGDIAHIVSESVNGPRGNSSLTPAQRNAEANLLLLCPTHHRLIDTDEGSFSTNHLLHIKKEHEAWVRTRNINELPWNIKLHHIYYVNVPRLNLLAALSGMSLDLKEFEGTEALHELGWSLSRLLAGFQKLLQNVELRAVELSDAVLSASDSYGLIVSFDTSFRTKNIRLPQTSAQYKDAITGDIDNDPHLYKQGKYGKVIVKINPRWITTTTAFCEFRRRGGTTRCAGLGIINSAEKGVVTITPYVIGLRLTARMEEFYSAFE